MIALLEQYIERVALLNADKRLVAEATRTAQAKDEERVDRLRGKESAHGKKYYHVGELVLPEEKIQVGIKLPVYTEQYIEVYIASAALLQEVYGPQLEVGFLSLLSNLVRGNERLECLGLLSEDLGVTQEYYQPDQLEDVFGISADNTCFATSRGIVAGDLDHVHIHPTYQEKYDRILEQVKSERTKLRVWADR